MTAKAIRVVALCVFQRADSILVFEAFDSVKGTPFYRPLGGGVEHGETSAAAVTREIQEELGAGVADVELLDVVENIFTLNGEPRHEIVFVYRARFADKTSYTQDHFVIREADGSVLTARWLPLAFFDEHHRLVPEPLKALLSTAR